MAQTMLGVRKYLTDNGIKDQDISYDANRKMVQVGGKDFYGATPESDGSTYGTAEALGSALSNYRNQQRNTQLDGLVNTMTQKVSSAQPFQYKAPTPFTYNAQTDPLYQNAMQAAQQGAQTATNNALVSLGRRGIGNSSSATTQANGIQQNAIGKVNSQILPQLQQQAYGQWQDQANRDYQVQKDAYNSEQDNFRNSASIADLLNGLSQQDWQNNYQTNQANEQAKNSRINLAQWLSSNYGINAVPKDDTQVAFDQVAGKQPLNAIQQAFEQLLAESGVTGMYKGNPTMQKQNQDFNNQIAQQNANTSAARSSGSGSSSSVSQQKYEAEQNERKFEGQVMDELSQLDPNEYEGWLEANRGEITRQLGTTKFEQIKKSVTKPSTEQNEQTSSNRKQAISLAKGDPDWTYPEKREALIQEYMGYLQ